ncbi:unnamed protein product [Phytophthora lilii]|uniref:Unnamed protein product n=1 Tax=Phytophthora lilii TaxID=2077276 RepID=A0A9W6TK92_9STRA|nr:unnamed protein product [Phytophthora lilii]
MKNTYATNAQGAGNRFCVSLKCGNFNVIDSMSLELNGKTIVSMADYKLIWNNIRAQTGRVFENTAISTTFIAGTISATASVTNDGFVKRLLSNPPNTGADSSTSWPYTGAASATTTIANQLGRGAFVAGSGTAGAIMGTWNYMLKIKLTDLHPIFKELDLMANSQICLRFRVNQGTSAIDIDSSRRMTLTRTTLSSGTTCPVMVASAASPNPMYSPISGAGSLAVSWGAAVNALEPTCGTYMTFATSRLYVPFVHLEIPQAIISKPVKKVRYNNCYAQLFYQRAGIGKQSTQLNAAFDLQLSASVKNANHDYDFHQFASEVSKIALINGDLTPELVNGLLDYQTWSLTNRVLIADVSRLTEGDVPQAIQIQGTNAGCHGTNMIVLVVSEQELSYDRLKGEILDYITA